MDAKQVRVWERVPNEFEIVNFTNFSMSSEGLYWKGSIKSGKSVFLRYYLLPKKYGVFTVGPTELRYTDTKGDKYKSSQAEKKIKIVPLAPNITIIKKIKIRVTPPGTVGKIDVILYNNGSGNAKNIIAKELVGMLQPLYNTPVEYGIIKATLHPKEKFTYSYYFKVPEELDRIKNDVITVIYYEDDIGRPFYGDKHLMLTIAKTIVNASI